VEAAQNAGMDTVVITTMHRKEEFADYKVKSFIKNYEGFNLRSIEVFSKLPAIH
jgi:beta-phosphoglucomutase-like phosphatase (HAD superfamily)